MGIVRATLTASRRFNWVGMTLIAYARYRFRPDVIRAVWLYLRFRLSCRDVLERLTKRGLDVS